MRIFDKSGKVLHEDLSDENDFNRPEIVRRELRQLLVQSLRTDSIIPGHHLRSIEPLSNGQHRLLFDNNMIDTADLVIGTDGAW